MPRQFPDHNAKDVIGRSDKIMWTVYVCHIVAWMNNWSLEVRWIPRIWCKCGLSSLLYWPNRKSILKRFQNHSRRWSRQTVLMCVPLTTRPSCLESTQLPWTRSVYHQVYSVPGVVHAKEAVQVTTIRRVYNNVNSTSSFRPTWRALVTPLAFTFW